MKRFALFEYSEKKDVAKYAELAAKALLEHGAECCARKEAIEQFDSELQSKIKAVDPNDFDNFADIVISFGGDGTILSAAQKLINSDIPIMGFNVGRLGFLAEYSVENIEKNIKDILCGNYRVVDRTVLETTINGEKLYALNDFVVEKKNTPRMITLHAYANEHYIGAYRADGLIITTPTGSTAYSLSCGGPIISPSTQAICITPISPHSLTYRPLVIPDSNEFKIIVKTPTGEANFVADGVVERNLKDGDSVVISLSASKVKLIKPMESSFYDLLRNKFLWASNTLKEQ